MSSKIDGVPRELLQNVDDVLYIMTGHDSYPRLVHKYGAHWWNPINEMRNGLCTLLAAPVVEHHPALWIDAAYLRDHSNECIPAFREPPSCEPTALYRAAPELAELQATIADLTEENTRNASDLVQVNLMLDDAEKEVDRLKSEIERLKGGQGEPVAWSYCPECGCEELHHEEGEHKQCANCLQEWFSDIDYSEVVRGNLAKLKASQPAPVSVGYKLVPLTPTPAMVQAGIDTPCGDDEHQDYRDVYASMIGAAP